MLEGSTEVKFHIITRGRNCSHYLRRCLKSVLAQSNPHWDLTLILDRPKDESVLVASDFVRKYPEAPIERYINTKRRGVCYNIYNIPDMEFFDGEDVLAFLDADDELLPSALVEVRKAYRKYDCLATCGSFITGGKLHRWNGFYPKGANHRNYKFLASHFKTVKVKVFETIPEEYFMHKGKWGQAASDVALMMAVIDRIGLKKLKHIDKGIYVYRERTNSDLSRELQKKWKKIWMAKKPLKRLF